MKRIERVGTIIRVLSKNPYKLYSLNYFCQLLGAAKSSISEDINIAKDILDTMDLGRIETISGVKGGLRLVPSISRESGLALLERFSQRLGDKSRILGGGLLYLSDMMFDSDLVSGAAEIFAGKFINSGADYVVTIETKGIPVALMTARFMNLPLAVVRRESRISEGTTIGINYFSGSSDRVQKMYLSKRAILPGSKAIIIDDFMRAGGSVRGIRELLGEFNVDIAGTGIMIVSREPVQKKVKDYTPLIYLEGINEDDGFMKISINEEVFT
ncbi:MAG: pur operon repressor [Anaerovoracaceae bacterium]|jgi:purine operon repressor